MRFGWVDWSGGGSEGQARIMRIIGCRVFATQVVVGQGLKVENGGPGKMFGMRAWEMAASGPGPCLASGSSFARVRPMRARQSIVRSLEASGLHQCLNVF